MIHATNRKVRTRHYRGTGPVDRCQISLDRTNGSRSVLVSGLEMSVLEMSGIAAAISDYLGVPVQKD